MTTALQIITKALQKNGVLTAGEAPAADMAADGLSALNGLIDSWSNDSLMIYARTTESFPLVSGQATYTIGTGQQFNTTRPIAIEDACYTRLSPNFDEPISVISDELYSQITSKATLGRPRVLNYSNAYPVALINLWPVPEQNYTLFITSEKPLSNWTLYQDVVLPPGWERALIFNLAIDLAPDYGQPISDSMANGARESKGNIARAVLKNRPLETYPQLGAVQNGYTGWFR